MFLFYHEINRYASIFFFYLKIFFIRIFGDVARGQDFGWFWARPLAINKVYGMMR
jgi:hypothetical protein